MEKNHPTIHNALIFAESKLAHLSNSKFEAELLLSLTINKDRIQLLTNPNYTLNPWQLKKLAGLVEKRANGEPYAYLTGEKEFFGRPFMVSAATLIPRPETEALINHAKALLKNKADSKILEVGTGSGVIAITLALEISDCQIKATDISVEALAMAKKNAKSHDVSDRINFVQQDLLENETEKFDLIVANLPYVEREWLDKSEQSLELKKEPHQALVGGETGTELIKKFITQYIHQPPAPKILLEHGDNQSEELVSFTKKLNSKAHTFSYQDLAGKKRYLIISLEDF